MDLPNNSDGLRRAPPVANALPSQQVSSQSTSQIATPANELSKGWGFLDKRMIFPLVGIIIILLTVFLFFYIRNNISPSEETEILTQSLPQSSAEEAVDGYSMLIDGCNARSVTAGIERDSCFSDLASAYLRTDFCAYISVQSGNVSVDSCYADVAIKAGRSQHCFMISRSDGPNSFSYCISKVAMINNNPELCKALPTNAEEFSQSACMKSFEI